MISAQITTSAALYFSCEPRRSVPLQWFERAVDIFAEHALSPILFSAEGGGFLIDECHVLADQGTDIVAGEGCVLTARRGQLIGALGSGTVRSLTLDSPRTMSTGRSDWRAMVDISLGEGVCYFGIDDDLICDTTMVLRRACGAMKGLFDVRYGFAYKSPLADEPDCYASGFVRHPLSETVGMIRHRGEWDYSKKSPDELWQGELHGGRRHLAGLFRGAYRANVLSESHLEAAEPIVCRIGKLSELDGGLWLWELSESDIPIVERILDDRKALVASVAR